MPTDGLPHRLYSSRGVRALDALAIGQYGLPGLTLMRRAATACVDELLRRWPACSSVAVFCGGGNNGGDGYIIAGMLAEMGKTVTVHVVGDVKKLPPTAASAHQYCLSTRAKVLPFAAGVSAASIDVVVDALLGIGLTGQVRPDYGDAIDAINGLQKPVLAVDVPSGLSADTGVSMGGAVVADATVTFIALKQGLFTRDGPDLAGDLVFDDLGLPAEVYDHVPPDAGRLTLPDLLSALPRRRRNAHKNQFGHVLVVGGDEGMGGAALMSAEAALRTGAGLVSVATHPAHTAAVLARRPELMVKGIQAASDLSPLLARASVVVLGPGLGRGDWSSQVYEAVLAATHDTEQLIVLDADGLHFLSLVPAHRNRWVLTPHPGEASNLLRDKGLEADRFGAVTRLQQKFGGVALLKGVGTVIHDGEQLTLCSAGNPGMATAGMGDVLSGVIGGLMAQGLTLSGATRLGVLVHAMAGDRAALEAGERGLLATDLMPHLRALLNDFHG